MMLPKTAPVRLYGKDKTLLRTACMERDGWTCQDCGAKVSDRFPDWYPLKAEMMHVVSLGAGGADELGNVRCGCHRCHGAFHSGNKPVPAK